MIIRLATLNTPLFDHEGMVLRESWSAVDTDDLTDAGREAISKYRGRILQVHPEDVGLFDELVAGLPTTPTHEEMMRLDADEIANMDAPASTTTTTTKKKR